MTVIAGILCTDGIALASDRQSTNSAFIPLATQPEAMQISTNAITKVTKIGEDLLIAVAGSPAIGDQYQALLVPHHTNFAKRNYDLATKRLRDEIREEVTKNCRPAHMLAPVIGANPAFVQCTCECLMAASFKDGIKLSKSSNLAHLMSPQLNRHSA
jgi:hypothetical protein